VKDIPVVAITGAELCKLKAVKPFKHISMQNVLINKNTYHTIQPLFYQVANANLTPTEIAYQAGGGETNFLDKGLATRYTFVMQGLEEAAIRVHGSNDYSCGETNE
jgi:hypothetical protein